MSDLKLTRRQLVQLVMGATAGFAGAMLPGRSYSKPRVQRYKHNVLLIVAGGERSWDHMPAHVKVPARERLLRRSVEFSRCIAASPTPTPALAALLTSEHGPTSGVTDNARYRIIGTELRSSQATLGTLMREGGWHTAFFGDWPLTRLCGPRERSDLLDDYGFSWSALTPSDGDPLLADSLTTRSAVGWLTTRAPTLLQPWLATVYLNGPRGALTRYANRHDTGMPSPASAAATEVEMIGAHRVARDIAHRIHAAPSADASSRPHLTRIYEQGVATSDARLGELLDALEHGGHAARTVVVYSSDCGMLLDDHGQTGSGPFAYRELVNIPLLIDHPDGPGAVNCKALTSSVDLLPTILSAVNVPHVAQVRTAGLSLLNNLFLPTVKGPRERSERGVLVTHSALSNSSLSMASAIDPDRGGTLAATAALLQATRQEERCLYRAFVDKHHKLVRYFAPGEHHEPVDARDLLRRNDVELYDLRNDPNEEHNLTTGPTTHNRLAARLNAALNARIADELGEDDGSYLPGPAFFWRS